MDPLIISSLDEIDIMGMGIDNPDHVKVNVYFNSYPHCVTDWIETYHEVTWVGCL